MPYISALLLLPLFANTSPRLGRNYCLGRELSTGQFRQHGRVFVVARIESLRRAKPSLRSLVALLVSLSLVVLPTAVPTTMAAPAVRVLVDAVEVLFPDQVPVISAGRTLVPLRFVSQDLGATVTWDDATSSVTMVFGSTRIVLVIGRQEITVNGVSRRLDVPAQIIGGRTMVPIRGIFESLGATVSWDQATNSVIITRQQAQVPGRIAFDPAVHVLPNGTMEMNKAIEFAKRALTNATFRFEGGNLVFNWVYEAPPELASTNFEVDLWSAVVQGVRGSFRHEWIVGNSPLIHDSLEVPDKQSFNRVISGLSNTDRIDNIVVRVGVRQTINGARTGTGHILVSWRPMYGVNISQDGLTWIVPPNNRGALVQYDIRQLFTWLR